MLIQSELVSIFDDVLKQRARLRKGGAQATYHCPFCADKNLVTQKLEIAISGPDVGSYHCWRCNVRGKSFGTLLRKLNAPQAYRDKLFKLTGDIRLAKRHNVKEDFSAVTLPQEFLPIAKQRNNPEYKNALAYLKRRGIRPVDILRYNIGYCETGHYAYHIIVPSYDANGDLNFFIGRRYYDVEGTTPTYTKPPVDMNIVGFECFVNWNEPISLCEGVFDAIAIRNNAIPLFGKYPSKKLREAMIVNRTKRVNMILDNDAINDAVRNCDMINNLSAIASVFLVRLDGKDPSVLGFERVHDLIRNAKEFDWDEQRKYQLGL
jgi:hypothetical protein